MIAYTTADSLVAGIIFGVVLALVGMGIIALVRSEWSERQARKAEGIVTSPVPFRHHAQTVRMDGLYNNVTVKADEWRPDVDRDMQQAVELARLLDHIEPEPLSLVAPVINFPAQRSAGRES